MKKLRCGFVGGGTIMRVHAEALDERQDVEITALAEVAEPVLKTSAEKFGIPGRYTDFNAMFQQERLDFAVICVPNAFHAPATLAALKSDCHVLCEKPPAMNVGEAKQMLAEAERRAFAREEAGVRALLQFRWPEAQATEGVVRE